MKYDKLYRCERCGEIFDEPDTETEYSPSEWWGISCREEWTVDICPFCGSDELEPWDEEEEETEEDRIFGRRCVG